MPDGNERLAKLALADPDLYPDEFKSWLSRFINDNPLIKLVPFQLPNVEPTKYVGGAGLPVFNGAWVNYASGYEMAGFYKDPLGRVFLTGLVKLGTAGTTIYSLPGGYRPANRELFSIHTDTGAGRIDIDASGNVIHTGGGTAFVTLSGISFRAF